MLYRGSLCTLMVQLQTENLLSKLTVLVLHHWINRRYETELKYQRNMGSFVQVKRLKKINDSMSGIARHTTHPSSISSSDRF